MLSFSPVSPRTTGLEAVRDKERRPSAEITAFRKAVPIFIALSLFLAIASLIPAAPSIAEETGFKVKPYVQGVDDSSAVVLWMAEDKDKHAVGYVEYGPTVAYGQTADGEVKRRLRWDGTMRSTGTWIGRAMLTGLAPDTIYHYRVVVGSNASEDRTFRTAPAGNAGSYTFVVLADSPDKPKLLSSIASLAESICDPSFVVHAGDIVNDKADKAKGTPPAFQPFQRFVMDTFGDGDFSKPTHWTTAFFEPAEPLLRKGPCFLARGNHEQHNKRMALYFEAPGGLPQGRFYSFDWGAAHFATIDTNRSYRPGSEQYEFLAADLAASSKPFKIFFEHHPPYSSARHGSTFRIRKYIQPILEANGVKLVFSGHDHSYQRTVVNGVTYIVVPTGGDETYPQANPGDNPSGLIFVRKPGFIQADVSAAAITLTVWTLESDGTPSIAENFTITP